MGVHNSGGSTVRVIGVVQCKNEWGLIAVSVTHALLHHVDAVWILDDGSTDQTAAGLEFLRASWGDRVNVVHLSSIGFEQEAITNTLIQYAILNDKPTWIYPFDADEFLVVDGNASLRAVLEAQHDDVDEIRYQVKNFVSPRDFDENSIDGYRRQRFQSKAERVASISTKENEIRNGTATFFDFGFMNKAVIRARGDIRLDRGSHSSKVFGRTKVSVTVDSMRAVHLPMITRQRIDRKAKQGKAHMDVGAPGGRGWQNQFIYKQQQAGKLDEFWQQHSVDPTAIPDTVTETSMFADAIEPTLVHLRGQFGGDNLTAPAGKKIRAGAGKQTEIGFDTVVRIAFAFQTHTNRLLRQANVERRASSSYRWAKSWKRARNSFVNLARSVLGRGKRS